MDPMAFGMELRGRSLSCEYVASESDYLAITPKLRSQCPYDSDMECVRADASIVDDIPGSVIVRVTWRDKKH